MTDQHTPTPWEYDSAEIYGAPKHTSVGDAYKLIARLAIECNPGELMTDEDHANAAFIVKAVNAHDDLVAALENALWHLDPNETEFQGKSTFKTTDLLPKIRAALAKASQS